MKTYLELLPNDIVMEICTYLGDIDIKHILEVRNYVDINLMITYIKKDIGTKCRMCKYADRHHNMEFMLGKYYCKECHSKLEYCDYELCDIPVVKNTYRMCKLCKVKYCDVHRMQMDLCTDCHDYFCENHTTWVAHRLTPTDDYDYDYEPIDHCLYCLPCSEKYKKY